MACEPPPPLAKKPKALPAAPTTICALADDLLREIFLHLPSLPSLVRAALTSRPFLRAVRSSPAFRRRFRELHSPPLLGIFLGIFEEHTPAFRPLRMRSDPDLTAAFRGSDFFLTRLPDEDEWVIRDCHDGYVLLISFNDTNQLGVAVYNPVTRALRLFSRPPVEICEEMFVEYHVLSSEEDHGSFRVICVCHEGFGAQVAVLSSETSEWQIFPWVDAATMQPALQPGDEEHSYHNGALVNGFIYWTQASRGSARVLNTTTLQFSRLDLPPQLEGQGGHTPGETKDGKLCIICVVKLTLVFWSRIADDEGIERWMVDKTFPLEEAIDELMYYFVGDHVVLRILAIQNGFLYLSSYCEVDHKLPGWLLSFCLGTTKLTRLCPIIDVEDMYPYIMVWPRSLVLDKPTSSSS